MTKTLMIVAEMAVINWALILAAALFQAQAWKPSGIKAVLGNAKVAAEPGSFAARLDRTARNMLENMVLFTAIVFVASLAGVVDPRVELGARIFFWARLAYIPIYLVGIPVARTGVWAISLIGMGLIVAALVHAA
jgi:uncharacterized MAPEG superfamily protein